MFHLVTRTWNPVSGCLHNCIYCWARRLALTRLKHLPRYKDGFKPRLNREEFRRGFKKGLVFVCDMGDLFGVWVPSEWIEEVINHVRRYPSAIFLFLTKNPERYLEFRDELSELDNVILGATIETDDDSLYVRNRISKAPLPSRRLYAMERVAQEVGGALMVSIEPVLDFSPNFADRILRVANKAGEFFVYVGYDNYNNRLPEPPLKKVLELIERLRKCNIRVYEKSLRKAWYEE